MQFEEKRKEKKIKNRLSINRIKDQNQKIDQLSRIAIMQNTESNSFQKLASLKKLLFACNSKRKEKKNKLKIDHRSIESKIKIKRSTIATVQNTESNSFQKLASLKKLLFARNSKRKEKKKKLKIDYRSIESKIKIKRSINYRVLQECKIRFGDSFQKLAFLEKNYFSRAIRREKKRKRN